MLSNSRGSTMMTVLISMAILAVVSLSLGGIVTNMAFEGKKTAGTSSAVSLQSEIIAALQRRDEFLAQLTTMQSAGNPTGLAITNGDTPPRVIAIAGSRIGFNLDGTYCDPTLPTCPIRTDLEIDCGSVTAQGCSAAYRVSTVASRGAKAASVLGAPFRTTQATMAIPSGVAPSLSSPVSQSLAAANATFLAADHIVPISYDIVTQPTSTTCTGANDILITGMDRQTGQVWCAQKSVAPCADGTVPERIQYNGTSLEYVCRPLGYAQCPADYVLQSISPLALDNGTGGPVAAGSCVYRWQDNVPWHTTGSLPTQYSSVAGYFCNDDVYNAYSNGNGSCSVVTTGYQTGMCWADCNCQTKNGVTACDQCGTITYPQIWAVASLSGGRVSCTMQSNGSCGAWATGYVTWSGTCRLKSAGPPPPVNNPGPSGITSSPGPIVYKIQDPDTYTYVPTDGGSGPGPDGNTDGGDNGT